MRFLPFVVAPPLCLVGAAVLIIWARRHGRRQFEMGMEVGYAPARSRAQAMAYSQELRQEPDEPGEWVN